METGSSYQAERRKTMSEQEQIFVSATSTQLSQGQNDVESKPTDPAAAKDAVTREVSSWEGVTVGQHRFGGVEFRVGRRELGHLHGTIADLPFPRRVRDELIAAARARPHHVVPDSGWITVPMRTTSEVASVIELFRQNYARATNVGDEQRE
jgi:hypothetical protein